MAKLSVVRPTYNTPLPILREAIESILCQTFSDFELILVNDGSRDSSGAICDEYDDRDERVVVIHQENSGVSVARNHGMEVAKGKYISFVDSDDWVEVDYLMSFICAKISIDSTQLIGLAIMHSDIHGKTIIEDGFSSLVYCVAKFYSKNIIQSNCLIFPPGQKIGEDTIFIASYLNYVKKYTVIPNIGYHYETNDHGTCMITSSNVYVSSVELIKNLNFLDSSGNTSLAVNYMKFRVGMSFFDFINKLYSISMPQKERVQFLKAVCNSSKKTLDYFPQRYFTDKYAKTLFSLSLYSLGDFILLLMSRIRMAR